MLRRRARTASGALAVLVLAGAPSAHAPHDVVMHLSLSPDFANDGTVLTQLNLTYFTVLCVSDDRGRSWAGRSVPMLAKTPTDYEFSPDFALDRTCFAATYSDGVYRSVDGGVTWNPSNAGLPAVPFTHVAASPAIATDGLVLVGGPSGCYRSSDGASTWAPSSTGLVPAMVDVIEFAPDDPSTVFAGSSSLFRSTDAGLTWTLVRTFPNPIASLSISPTYTTDQTLAVGFGLAGGGVELSTDAGASWSTPSTGLTDLDVNDLDHGDDGTLFAATSQAGVFYLTSPGSSWVLSDDGLPALVGQTANHWRKLAVSPDYSADGTVFVGAFEGLTRTEHRDGPWRALDLVEKDVVRELRFSPDFANDGIVFAGDHGGGVMRYQLDPALPRPGASSGLALDPVDAGTWTWGSLGMERLWSSAMDVSPNFASDQTLFYSYTSLYTSTDGGLSYTGLSLPSGAILPREIALSPDYAIDQTLILGTEVFGGTHLSNDGGSTWTRLVAGMPTSPHAARSIGFSPAFASDRTVFVTIAIAGAPDPSTGVYKSTDGGITWAQLPTFPSADKPASIRVSPNYVADRTVFVGMSNTGLYRTSDGGVTWANVGGLPPAQSVHVNSISTSPAFAIDRTVFATLVSEGVYRSTDGGVNWAPSGDGGPDTAPWGVTTSPGFVNDRTVILHGYDWLHASTDGGDTWKRMPQVVRVDEGEPSSVVEDGTWTEVSDIESFANGYSSSSVAGDRLAFEFHGDSVAWHANRTPSSGLADVTIDGVPAETVDLYASARVGSTPVFQRDFAELAWRTIEVTVRGSKNPLSTGTDVENDGFSFARNDSELPSFYGPGHSGTGGWIPTVLPCCPLTPGTTPTLEVRGGRGGAVGALVIAAAPTRVEESGGLLLVDSFLLTAFHVLDGTPGAAGAGTASLPVVVPSDPTLSGLVLVAQTGYLDSGAEQGISLSRGVRLPIP